MAVNCPICKLDLSPLDLISRTEHAELCVENGPAILEYTDTGQAVIKRNQQIRKQRKICPICDKTFQTIHLHYRKCALKNDILPDMMLQHWDKINQDSKTNKDFPPDLLRGFISQRVKENRVGEQVEYAQALLSSMTDGEPQPIYVDASSIPQEQNGFILLSDSDTNQTTASASNQSAQQQVVEISASSATISSSSHQGRNFDLMSNAATTSGKPRDRGKPAKKFAIQLVDDAVKRVNIDIRRERELAVSADRRFDMIQAAIDEQEKLGESSSTQQEDEFTINWLDRLT